MSTPAPIPAPISFDPNDVPTSLLLLLGRIKNEGLAGYLLVDFAFAPAEAGGAPNLPASSGPWEITLSYRDSLAHTST